jgi:predicted flap endonuclease-1-like 5' DNA nuclease
MVAAYDGQIKGLNSRISGLEGDLADCSSKRADLEGDLAITKGRMREIEAKMEALKAEAGSSKKGNKGKGGSSNISALTDNSGSGGGNINLAGAGASSLTSSGTSSDKGDTSSASGGNKKSIYRGVKSDNLQIIEGVGPKMESVLKENGVNSHSDLAAQTPDSLQAILGKYGDKYKIIDPTTWAQQAGYAAEEDFDGLIDLQKKLDTGKDNAAGLTASKLEKYLIKTGALKAFKQDDLKAIEGIGPATEKLLHENGIKTWRDLANTEASDVKAILSAAGSRFALGDPTTWPKQAELAADGKFDELREYQDFLDGGRA